MKQAPRNIFRFWLIPLVAFQACSTTRNLPEGEVLYTGTRQIRYEKSGPDSQDWKINQFAEKSKDVLMGLWVSPNGALGGMPYTRFLPLRLYWYNWFYTEKDHGFSYWMMRNFGEPPVTIRSVNPEARVKSIENQLFNMGHFGIQGSYELRYRGTKKASIRYTFKIPEASQYRNIQLNLNPSQETLREPLTEYMKYSRISKGKDFNLDDLALEKKSMWEHLQNQGFFYIQKNQIAILADTSVSNKQVDIEYRIDNQLSANQSSRTAIENSIVRIDDRIVDLTASPVSSGRDIHISKQLLDRIIEIKSDSLYSLDKTRKTIRNTSGIGIFSEPVITYTPVEVDSLRLLADIDLKTTDLFGIGINTNVSQKNSGFVGPGLGLSVTQKNLLKGAENLSFNLDGYLDFPYGVYSERISRSSGISANAVLGMPVTKSPFPFIVKNAIALPRRNLSLGFEFNHRPDYFTLAEWKGSYGLAWKISPQISHDIKLLNLSYTNILTTTPAFDSLYEGSGQIRNSYSDQFISGSSYAFTYNSTANLEKKLRIYYRGELEWAGNLIHGIQAISGNSGTDKSFLGVNYSQYIRFVSDFRAYLDIGNRGSELVFRNLLGAGYAYGNSTTMPYVRQFFIGGTNSLRPLAARSVGPGRYIELDEQSINQVGDLKLELNLEYRFKIAYLLHGAVWGDFGNIWLLKEDPARPLSNLRLNRIFEDSYFTSGIGLRLDVSILVVRVDYGAILYAPLFVDGSKWLWQNKLPLYGFVFGFGYPF